YYLNPLRSPQPPTPTTSFLLILFTTHPSRNLLTPAPHPPPIQNAFLLTYASTQKAYTQASHIDQHPRQLQKRPSSCVPAPQIPQKISASPCRSTTKEMHTP
ncbi:MAG: hypothetical protein AAGJ35_10020, partial [Myxococcota bacterium]